MLHALVLEHGREVLTLDLTSIKKIVLFIRVLGEKLRNIDEIRGSIKDLILKAENEELLNIQTKESQNLSNESENSENQLSDEILKQINLEVKEFQKAFKENGSEELISQTIRETIKPILHEWLKINLPVIVKEVIDEKINEIREKN